MKSPTDELRAEIDTLILAGNIIPAIASIKTACGVSLLDARNLFRVRYQQLRAERGAEFTCGDDDYWSGYGEDLSDAIAKGW